MAQGIKHLLSDGEEVAECSICSRLSKNTARYKSSQECHGPPGKSRPRGTASTRTSVPLSLSRLLLICLT
jgi:hypothetical protein